jgi:hypothetical protein
MHADSVGDEVKDVISLGVRCGRLNPGMVPRGLAPSG